MTINSITSGMINIASQGIKKALQEIKKAKNKDKYTLSDTNKDVLLKKPDTYKKRSLSEMKIDKYESSEKPMTLDNIYKEKGSKGVTDHLINELKQLTPELTNSVNPENKQDTLENQSIKKHLNSQLEKEINKEIDSLIEKTQLEELSTNATFDSSFERHKLFNPLIKLRDGLQKDHNLDVFTDQLSNQAQKSFLGMDYNARAKIVEEVVGSENIDADALSKATENNYNRNYGHFPDTLPTSSKDELANAITTLSLSEIREDILGNKSNLKKRKQPIKKTPDQNKKELSTLKTKIGKLTKSGALDTDKLETKYQKLKTENHAKNAAESKTELQTQNYIGKLTLQAVREKLGEEQSKIDIDDRWSTIKTEFDSKLESARDEAIKIIQAHQDKTAPPPTDTTNDSSQSQPYVASKNEGTNL